MKRFLSMLCAGLLMPAGANAEPALPVSDQATVIKDGNRFAIDLYARLRAEPGNLFFSPESIFMVLAMPYAGAKGDTASQMANIMHFSLPQEKLHPAMADLLKQLNATEPGYRLRMANALWTQKGYPLLPDFLTLAKENYGAGVQELDFKKAAEAARQTINQWTEQQTDHKIRDLLPQNTVTKNTSLVLTNAIYFKGDWADPFKKGFTRDEDFHVSASETKSVPLMHRTEAYMYMEGNNFQALELPYSGKKLSMVVFLPKAVDGLAAFEQSLTADKLEQWLDQLHIAYGAQVTLPKFKTESEFSLKDTLGAMGIKSAFNYGDADFSGINGNRDLFLSAVIHKAFVDVNEDGTEAAAASGLAMGAGAPPAAPPIFRADHPFMFLIRDRRSGAILFMGRVIDPSK